MINCPNCCAPITSYKCLYCGTVFNRPKEEIDIICDCNRMLSALTVEALYKNALRAMRNYSGTI